MSRLRLKTAAHVVLNHVLNARRILILSERSTSFGWEAGPGAQTSAITGGVLKGLSTRTPRPVKSFTLRVTRTMS